MVAKKKGISKKADRKRPVKKWVRRAKPKGHPFEAEGRKWAKEKAAQLPPTPTSLISREMLEGKLLGVWRSIEPLPEMSVTEFSKTVENVLVTTAREMELAAEKEQARMHAALEAIRPPLPQPPTAPVQTEYCVSPPPPPPPLDYPAASTPSAPGQAMRRVPVPTNVIYLRDDERRMAVINLTQEEMELDKLTDLQRKAGPSEAADEFERTAAAVRGDIMRLRFRDSIWAALGHLERLFDKSEPEGVPELEDHLQRVDKALQAAVAAIVREMHGGSVHRKSGL
jgi:hypothetical protein